MIALKLAGSAAVAGRSGRWRQLRAVAAWSLLMAGCGGDSPNVSPITPPTEPPSNPPPAGPTNPPPTGPTNVVRRVTVTPDSIDIPPGTTTALQATAFDSAGPLTPQPAITWSTTNSGVATATASGSVTAIAPGDANIIATVSGVADTARVHVAALPPLGLWTEVQPEVALQEMTGWEGSAQIGEVECNPQAYAAYRQPLLNQLVNELGINRVRLPLRSGNENPVDYYSAYKTSHSSANWNPHRYESVNDNNDPFVANAAGFQWAEIDHKVQDIIDPMRALLQARGERLYVNLNYTDFGALQPWEHSSNPEEYAELIVEAFKHLQSRYGWVPDAVEMILEPDNTPNWNPQTIGKAIVATGDRLKASGFTPAFIAPSNTSMSSALSFIDQLVTMPRVLEYLTDVAYHRYSGVSAATLAGIAARAKQYGLRTAMLEHIGSGHDHLYEDVHDGNNSAWQQFVLGYCSPADDGGVYYRIDQSVPSSPRILMGSRTRYLRQYFAFVRLNARRIGAVSGDSRVSPLAFRNANGKYVVVLRSTAPGAIQIRRLPPGTYGVTVTTASQTFASLGDIVVGSAGTLQTSIAAAGVITIHQR